MPPCEGGYKEFRLGDLFSSTNGDTDIKKEHLNGLGDFVISSGESANGIVGSSDIPAKVFAPNTLTIDMFGNAYFHPYKYKIVTHARIFSLSNLGFSFTTQSGLYFVSTLKFLKHLFSYNNMCSWEKIKDLQISLPVKNSTKEATCDNIDFNFIESRMRELEEERMRELEAYLTAAGFADCSLTPAEEEALRKFSNGEVKLCAHNIIDTFHVANTHNILKSDVVFDSGATPYVTASASNNSIVSRISYKQEMIEQGNSIMIGGKTLVITYQPDAFFSNDSHNLILRPKNIKGENESCELFTVAALYKSLAPKYSWGDSISKQKIQTDKVFLPTNTDNEIDYPFMETYISAIKKQIIQQLKDFITKEHATYLQVIKETE